MADGTRTIRGDGVNAPATPFSSLWFQLRRARSLFLMTIALYVEVLCDDRQPLIDFLENQGIQTRALPPDMHLSPYLDSSGEFPNSRVFSERGLMLPSGPTQPLESVDRVVDALRLYRKVHA